MKVTCWTLLAIVAVSYFSSLKAESTTQAAVPFADDANKANSTQAPVTTPKPKINIAASDICKKCKCDTDYFVLDCSSKQLSNLLSASEWAMLQNGDVLFETINFNNNSISTLPILPTYPVHKLYFGFNQINNITLGAFQNLQQLTHLDLSHNQLTSKILVRDVFLGQYSPSAYDPLNLIELDLAYNQMHTLKADVFAHLPKLESLILCKNIFQIIDSSTLTAIESLSYLKTLDLSYMELSSLPETIFHSPNELETLLLSGNLFQQVPDALKFVKNLKKLVMDENPLNDLAYGNFSSSLATLTYLSISFLPHIQHIGPGALSQLQNLTILVASDNPKLKFIHPMAFSKNTSNPELFDYPPINELHLNNNNLTNVEHDWLVRWQDVRVIDLRFNPWVCDCTNDWLIHSLMKEINNTTPQLTKNVRCASPSAWKDKLLMDLTAEYKELLCENTSHPEKDSLILVGILVGVLIGIPITLGSLVLYRRGCFGLRNRISPAAQRYNRASFADDFHI